MSPLAEHAGRWAGTNQFRLMPSDPFHEAPASADVSIAAAGNLAVIAYAWSHPQDGRQDGLLVVGPNNDPEGVVALWGDSWHQSPAPKVLIGSMRTGIIVTSYEYGDGWHWRITVDATTAESLLVRMDNVLPGSAAAESLPTGTYAAMVTSLRRVA